MHASLDEMQKAGEKIKILIRSKGWRQEDFAEHIGYDPSHLSRLLKAHTFRIKQIDKIAKGLGLESQYLLQILESDQDLGNGAIPEFAKEPEAIYLKPADHEAKLRKRIEVLEEELEMMRQRLVEEKRISEELAARLEEELKHK